MSEQVVQTNTSQTSQTIPRSQIIAETNNNFLFVVDLRERRWKMVNAILTIMEKLNLELKKMEIKNENNRINLINIFLDKLNNFIEKKVIVITSYEKLRDDYINYKYKVILESRLKEEEENAKKEENSEIRSKLYYNYEKDTAILVYSYLPSIDISDDISDTVISEITYMELKKRKLDYIIIRPYAYVTLYKNNRVGEDVLELTHEPKYVNRYLYLRGDLYDELGEQTEFKILNISNNNIIITEVTPLSTISFIRRSI